MKSNESSNKEQNAHKNKTHASHLKMEPLRIQLRWKEGARKTLSPGKGDPLKKLAHVGLVLD